MILPRRQQREGRLTSRPFLRTGLSWRRGCALVLCIGITSLLTGCIEQLQSPQASIGSLYNFYQHLYAGELDDARSYMAPGLVERTPELDRRIKEASQQLRRYEVEIPRPITDTSKLEEDLGNGERRQLLPGKTRPRPLPGETVMAEEWQYGAILSARMVRRGPGWRILDFKIECCP